MIFSKFKLGFFWGNVASVLTGTAIAQAIPLIGSLVIARQYIPGEFGVFAMWLGVVFVLAVILTGRFETSLAIESDGEPRRLAVFATFVTILLTSLTCLGLLVALYVFGLFDAAPWTDNLPLAMAMAVLPAAIVVAFFETWQSWAAAEGEYRKLSILRITQTLSIVSLQILAGTIFPTAASLAISHSLGILISLVIAYKILPVGIFPDDPVAVVLKFWKRHSRFPCLSLPADVISTAAGQLPIIIVASKFGSEIAGLLAMTIKVLGAPIGLLGRAVLDVFKRHASSSFRERGECKREYIKTFTVLLVASAVFCILMLLLSESLFAFAFGERWRLSGTIAIWLLPLFALRFVASPLSYMVYIVGKQHIDLFWQLALLCVTIVSLSLPHSYSEALQLYGVGCSVLYAVYLIMSYQFSLGTTK
jgi:O-antigen/teichoic acid export membrane protein